MAHGKLALAVMDGQLRRGTVDALDFLLSTVRYTPARSSIESVSIHIDATYVLGKPNERSLSSN